MTTIRQLTAAFGFEVDTTPIARWNSAINDAKKGARGLNQIDFGGLRNSLSGLGSLLNLRVLTPIGLIAGSIALAKKSFEKFADEEQALAKLRSQLQRFPGSFEDILKTIDRTRESTGGLISRLEGLSIASRFFEITTSPEAFNKLFDSLTKLSITRGKDVTSIIADAIATGGTEALKELGFTVQELELLTKSGREFSTVGVLQRTRLIEDLLKKAEQRINKDFQEFSLTGAASIKREQVAREELIITIGQTNDMYKKFVDSLTEAERNLNKNITETGGLFTGLAQSISDAYNAYIKVRNAFVQEYITGPLGEKYGPQGSAFQEAIKIPQKTFGLDFGLKFGEQKQEIVINAPITINGGVNNETDLARAVRLSTLQIFGQAKDMAERTRIVYGKNQK